MAPKKEGVDAIVARRVAWRCGVDEAGRGSLAGPLYAAAVVLDAQRPVMGLTDSKRLTAAAREQLCREIFKKALAYGIASASRREIDDRGIEWANRIAFTRAVKDLLRRSDTIDPRSMLVRIDGNRTALRLGLRQETVVGGDRIDPAIGAASIVAKVSRDRYVLDHLHARFPAYGFDRHKGYATQLHAEALSQWGPTGEHRRSFRLPGVPHSKRQDAAKDRPSDRVGR